MKNQKFILPCVFLIVFINSAWSIPGLNPDFTLNKEEIKAQYFEGEFETVKSALEMFRKNMDGASREDSIFLYKYLAVIYAADDNTKDKSESYMYQLLKLAPSAELLDMYISDTIQAIFNKVRSEYVARERYLNRDKSPAPAPASSVQTKKSVTPPPTSTANKKSKSSSSLKSSKKWIWWTAGGVVLAGAVTGFLLLSKTQTAEVGEPEKFTNQ
ncbi:MAG: hypothetical protein HQK83_08055 [Fibrobacteria bacterium]|nr:hypothetical protein [Fibrobacteria bacterium]